MHIIISIVKYLDETLETLDVKNQEYHSDGATKDDRRWWKRTNTTKCLQIKVNLEKRYFVQMAQRLRISDQEVKLEKRHFVQMAQRKTIVDDQRPGLLDVWFQKFEKTFVKKSCEEKCKKTSTIFLVFWMSNAGFWEIDDKKICVQTSFSRIPLRICREEKMKQKKYCEQVQYSLKNEAIKNTTQN